MQPGLELDGQKVTNVLRSRLDQETWRGIVLETQVQELQSRLDDSEMEVQQLRYRVEELETAQRGTPGGDTDQ